MGASDFMKNIYDRAETPWESKAAWQIVNRNLDYLIHRHRDELKNIGKRAKADMSQYITDSKSGGRMR